MPETNVVPRDLSSLPPELRIAQEAIHLPEVQAMLQKLSTYNLGICMPHVHDDRTGEFLPRAKNVIQVETDLEVSFQPAQDVLDHPETHLPVGWVWHEEQAQPMWAMACVTHPNDTMHYSTNDLVTPRKKGSTKKKGTAKKKTAKKGGKKKKK
jgi:hypothetical protein